MPSALKIFHFKIKLSIHLLYSHQLWCIKHHNKLTDPPFLFLAKLRFGLCNLHHLVYYIIYGSLDSSNRWIYQHYYAPLCNYRFPFLKESRSKDRNELEDAKLSTIGYRGNRRSKALSICLFLIFKSGILLFPDE